jgi:hypothetical protein
MRWWANHPRRARDRLSSGPQDTYTSPPLYHVVDKIGNSIVGRK